MLFLSLVACYGSLYCCCYSVSKKNIGKAFGTHLVYPVNSTLLYYFGISNLANHRVRKGYSFFGNYCLYQCCCLVSTKNVDMDCGTHPVHSENSALPYYFGGEW